ncbi:hypothetical protein B0F90DRAFT_1813320 [Multifurca ochricompacta]|uniref:Acetyl-CoA synthetase-like protein n=1 Tax=Multifurca ochricompacta TaxID=376703 RepID=A0AAD4MCQ9_9AGAM|nr:hypothetical protein B0F90DRAFT_1813320 [Multifurca ochricompacta]
MNSFGSALTNFRPTPASIPPSNAHLTLHISSDLPVNFHPLNPLEFLLRAAQIYPDRLALLHPDVQFPVFYTYSVWAQRVQNFAYGLLRAGIQPGDRIAVLAPNSPMIADALQGVIGARAIVTTINTRLTKDEIDYILTHSGARLIFVDHDYKHLVSGATAPIIVSDDTGRPDDPYEGFLTAGRVYSQEKGWAGLEIDSDENKPLSLNYTSGTTGRPKGTYLAAVANAFETQMSKESTYLWWAATLLLDIIIWIVLFHRILPMFHAAGWTFPWSITFSFATQAVSDHLANSRLLFDLEAFLELRSNTLLWSSYSADRNHEPSKRKAAAAPNQDDHCWCCTHRSAPCSAEVQGFQPVHVYGLTETYGPFTRNYPQSSWFGLSPSERAKLSARQGHAFATSAPLRVVRPTTSPGDKLVDVPRDGKTVGEIVARGNIVMQGYFQDPEATARAFEGGYFHSGDLAVWHPDGSVQIQDRSKDIIISGGENASSLAIEQELASHPDVLEVSVVGREHPKWGERPMAFVILHAGSAERWAGNHKGFSSALKAHARKRLPGFATPEWIAIVEELPKTSTGKIMKTVLRKRAAASAKL